MSNRVVLIASALALSIGTAGFASAGMLQAPVHLTAIATDVAGQWSGAIKLPGVELKVQVLLATADDKWIGTIDIPQQGAKGLKLQQITVDGDVVSFQIADIPGTPTFSGKHDGESKITGDFSQGGQTFPFELIRGELAKAKRPQNPAPPFPYAEEMVSVTNGAVKLAGTLTVPPGRGPFPVVILVSGSGPQNRDEELFEHRPFAVWADHFSRAGIAVLRYDDRGVGESTGDHASATTSMLASDAESWIALLKQRTDIGAIGMMGHSEGGIIAPMVAARNPDVKFIVMLAGTGVTGAEVLAEQNRALALASGATPEASDKIAVAARAAFKALADKADPATIHERIIDLVKAQTGQTELNADVERAVGQAMAGLDRPWFKEFLAHDPAVDLRKVHVPVLAIFGERDVQVVASQNRVPVEGALKEAGNGRVTVKVVPGANHLMQKCTTGGVDEYGTIETTIDPSVLDLVRDWITANAGKSA